MKPVFVDSLIVRPRATSATTAYLQLGDKFFPCALGRGGKRRAKLEGDGTTPVGTWPLRRVLYRPDRLSRPRSGLPVHALRSEWGWCDDPVHERYNTLIKLPFSASHENLWRSDGLYDLVITIGYNDEPIKRGKGSAIFLHVAAPQYEPTQGCIALALPHLQIVVSALKPSTTLIVT